VSASRRPGFIFIAGVYSGRFGLSLGLVLLVHILGITFVGFHVADHGDPGGGLGDLRLLYHRDCWSNFRPDGRRKVGGEDEDQNHHKAHVRAGAANGSHRAGLAFGRPADADQTAQGCQEPTLLV